jgi:hypothetical protein
MGRGKIIGQAPRHRPPPIARATQDAAIRHREVGRLEVGGLARGARINRYDDNWGVEARSSRRADELGADPRRAQA